MRKNPTRTSCKPTASPRRAAYEPIPPFHFFSFPSCTWERGNPKTAARRGGAAADDAPASSSGAASGGKESGGRCRLLRRFRLGQRHHSHRGNQQGIQLHPALG